MLLIDEAQGKRKKKLDLNLDLLKKKKKPPASQVVLLFRQYSLWDADPSVSAIVLRGSGEKAFCAGGDVKAAASAVASGKPEVAFSFFKNEFRLNHLISRLTKPHVALIDGIVMGGGAGLSVHGNYRVATETTLFAMPECAIGLFPDVGTTFFLPRACGLAAARWIALTGARLKGREVVESGVGTHFVKRTKLPELVEALARLSPAAAAEGGGGDSSSSPSWVPSWLLQKPLLRNFWGKKKEKRCPVAAVLADFEGKASSPCTLPSPSSFASFLAKDVERLFGRTSESSSLSQLRESVFREASSGSAAPEWLRNAASALETECPQSQALSWALLEESSPSPSPSKSESKSESTSLADTLRLEWRVLSRVSLLKNSDFVEGVDAKLLSKPARAARWRGDGGEAAARAAVSSPLSRASDGREELELEEGGRVSAAAFQSRF